jgi:uncharacterized membrane protein YkvI
MFKSPFFKKYLLPGLVFQSITIAGGYGTGRELVEFFLSYGPLGGLLAMGLNTVIWCLVCAVTFELARVSQTFDYRSFTRVFLGRGWFLYELCYLGQALLVLAVIAAAAGSILKETFSVPYIFGVLGMMAGVGFLVFKGTGTIEKFLSFWSLVLYAVYFVFLVSCLSKFGGDIFRVLSSGEIKPRWFMGGVEYAAYNIGILPAVLFCTRHIVARKEAVGAGLLAGPIGILPGFFFYLAMIGQYPEILGQTVPANYLLTVLGSRGFQFTFQIVLLGTLIETGTGLIHAFNERIAGVYHEKKQNMPGFMRPAIGVTSLTLAAIVAQFGLIDLIAKGYGTITYGFWAVFLIPVLTVGLYKIIGVGPRQNQS